jgi:hypothetical protein
MLAAVALLALASAAHAEHFQYAVDLSGTASGGDPEGCFPPLFNQPSCPHAESFHGVLSFDTPVDGDGSWLIEPGLTDITNFNVSGGVGTFSSELLVGDISVTAGQSSGTVQALDGSETFTFDWATRSAEYSYAFGPFAATGDFTGTMSAVPEPDAGALLLAGLAGLSLLAAARARRGRQLAPQAAKSGFSKPGLP